MMDARPPMPGLRSRARAPRRRPLFLLTILALFIVFVGLAPWALHIGGQSTPLGRWDGYGQLQASNGGRYVLFTHLDAGPMYRRNTRHGAHGGRSNNVSGTAELCTSSGVTRSFKLAGVVAAWWTTDGARTSIDLTGGEPQRLPSGWVVALHGAWHGPELELTSPDNSFTEVFTPRGEIRRVTSTADAGTARVTLRSGSHAEFEAACRSLQGG
jgi:hypothetical protein